MSGGIRPIDGRRITVEARGRIIGWFVTQGRGVIAYLWDGGVIRPVGQFLAWRVAGDVLLMRAGLPPVGTGR